MLPFSSYTPQAEALNTIYPAYQYAGPINVGNSKVTRTLTFDRYIREFYLSWDENNKTSGEEVEVGRT